MKKLVLSLTSICSLFLFTANAQISGIINRYTPVTAIDTCTGRLSVGDTTGFQVGNAVLLIQMQGANIITSNTATFGTVSAINFAGHHERALIDSVSANAVFLKNILVSRFNPAGKVQLVRIPQFTNITVSDTLRAQPWNGSTGGVLALEVSGTLTLNAPIVATGTGFRGGADYVASGNACNAIIPITGYVFGLGNWRGGYKGEGIALLSPGLELGRGPQANGGGGGNDHNAGGGGGSNVSNGGKGGNNADPNLNGCNGYFPGLGGYAPPSISNRIFLGGGGGAGHSNNLLRSKGGAGGGIVVLKASSINGSNPAIYAKGFDAGLSLSDGAGGGGAGGSIWLDLTNPNPNLVLNANGGRGGNADNNNVDRCMGPGGGGSGGRILTNAPAGNFSVAGGQAGITINSTIACNNSTNTAETGAMGEIKPLSPLLTGTIANFAPELVAQPLPVNVCLGEDAVFTLAANDGPWIFQWQVNAGAAWQDILGGNYAGFNTDSLIVQNPILAYDGLMFRCRILRAGCSEIISNSAVLHILPIPTVAFNFTMNGTTASFNNLSTNATNYFWNFGDGSNSMLANPMHTYTSEGSFTVTLSAWNGCDTLTTQQTVNILFPPTAGFSVPNTIFGCGTAQVNFQNLSSSNTATFNWLFPGGMPGSSTQANPSITYATSGIYSAQLIVSNMAGKDTLFKTFEVEIFDLPNADFTWQVQSGGLVQFNNLSQNGETFTWDFGDGSPQQNGFNIQHDYTTAGTYVVTLIVNSPCGVSIIQKDVMVAIVGTNELQQTRNLRIFPNPASNWLTVDWSEVGEPVLKIIIFDSAGKLVYLEENPSNIILEIPIESFADGIYQVLASFRNGTVSRAVVKN
ncbi:MAG: PKD domain-containing protein [Saprospiraceae bacterium]